MEVTNKREIVWHIKDNKLVRESKMVSKFVYDGYEFSALKSDRKDGALCCLTKDNNNEYWALNSYPFEFDMFVYSCNHNDTEQGRKSRESTVRDMRRWSPRRILEEKLKAKHYFNLCELEYISRYHPEWYEPALKCRNDVIEKIKAREELEEKEKIDKVTEFNNKFRERVKKIKTAIYNKQEVEVEGFVFYKDDNYYKGKICRNCFLYLADEYKIELPLHIRSFINNKLVKYDFETQKYWYKRKKTETTVDLRSYMNLIYENVKHEYQKIRDKKMRGVDNEREHNI